MKDRSDAEMKPSPQRPDPASPLPPPAPVPPADAASPAAVPLLLVSDRAALLKTLASSLRQSGYDVVECSSRQEGLRLLKSMKTRAGLIELSGGEAAFAEAGAPVAGPGRPSASGPAQLTGSSQALQSLRRMVERLAPTDLALLVAGESGAGKKHLARVIHESSTRRELSFVALDAGTCSEQSLDGVLFGCPGGVGPHGKSGLLGGAGVGTVYLGAIEALTAPLQRKLLLAIEEGSFQSPGDARSRPVTARIVCGTSRVLSNEVEQGRLLYDLFSRLSLYELRVPPLRERTEDIPLLVRALLERLCRHSKRWVPELDPGAEQVLLDSPWPGNVRELGIVLERTLSLLEGTVIRQADLPTGPYRELRRAETLKEARQQFELEHLQRILARCGGDKRKAAELLGLDISSLYRMLRSFRQV
jgi:DNA-binding NtrC family response regulator